MWRILRTRLIQKRSMRSQHRSIRVRVEALDQEHLLRSLIGKEVPLVLRIMFDAVCLAFEMWVDEAIDNEVFIRVHRAPVGHC